VGHLHSLTFPGDFGIFDIDPALCILDFSLNLAKYKSNFLFFLTVSQFAVKKQIVSEEGRFQHQLKK
jgi:hypothetical protein